jgi:parallel beta-helix repeat protein
MPISIDEFESHGPETRETNAERVLGFLARNDDKAYKALEIADATGVVLTGVTATENGDGVVLSNSDGIRVSETNASDNDGRGIALLGTNDSTVRASTVLDNGGDGLRLQAADGNDLRELTASGNDWTYRATGNGRNSVTDLSLVPDRPAVPDASLSFTANDVRLRPAATPTDPGPGPGNRTFDGTVTVEATETPGQFETTAAAFADLRLSFVRDDLREPRLDEGTARLHVFDGTWSEVPGSGADTDANVVSANLSDPAGTYSPVADLENAIRNCDDDPDEPGTWQVVTDINADVEQCLVVAADDVTVRGNAHSITGADGAGSEGVVLPAGARNVTVRNLTVQDWATGVAVRNTGANLTRLSVRSNTGTGVLVDGATDAIVFRTAAADTGVEGGPTTAATEGVGVRVVDSTRTRLIRLSVTGTTGDGVLLDGASDPMLRTLVLGGNDDWDLRETATTRGAIAADLRLFDPADADPTVTTEDLPASRAVRLAAEDDPTQPADEDLRSLSRYVNLSGSTSEAFADIRVFYPDGTDVENLGLYRDAGDTGEYVPVEGAMPDRERGTIGANLTALSGSQLTFAPLVDTSDSTPTDSPTPTSPGDETPSDSPDDTPTPTPGGSDDDDSTEVGAGPGGGGGGGDTDDGTGSPSFRTVDASVNRTTVQTGGDLAVNATVTNEGDGFGRYDVVLYRNDRFVGSRFVDLGAGETTEITFDREPSTAGEYTFRVENVTAGTVNVSGPPVTPTPTPTPSPTPTPGTPGTATPGTPDDGSDGTPNTPTTADSPTGSPTTPGGTPTTSPTETPTASPTVAPTPTTAGGSGASPSPTGGGSGGIGPLGIAAGGVGVLAVGAGAAYYLLTRPV